MTAETTIDLKLIAQEVGLPVASTGRALTLLDGGNTVAFITRFRKDQIGGLDEEQVRRIETAASKHRQLAERKEAVLKSISAQNRLTEKLRDLIESTNSAKQLEDLYLPYRPKKQTLATIARQRGLEPLADRILAASEEQAEPSVEEQAALFAADSVELTNAEDVLDGVRHLLAERFSEQAEIRIKLRGLLRQTGRLATSRVAADEQSDEVGPEKETEPAAKTKRRRRKAVSAEAPFQDYFDYREAISKVPPHRVLAINRGERAKVLRVRLEGDGEQMFGVAAKTLVSATHPHAKFLRDCVRDATTRLIIPSLERELRRELTEKAEQHAIDVFARNLRQLLLQPPIHGRRVLAIDPGFRSGCKLAVLDEFGTPLSHGLIYIVGKEADTTQARQQLTELLREYHVSLIAIGNGTACRETETLVAEIINNEFAGSDINYVIVNEAGASVYSTSAGGREELPDVDPIYRSTISIGRRLLDPLSELVKISPANIGVGLYQHDVKAKPLRATLDAVVESCVNFVGVDVNTASPALLSYVSGLNQLTARRIYEHRCQHGPFKSRAELREVPGIGEATFVQAAGFLKITDGDNPLDATWIHPESYEVAKRLLDRLDSSVTELSARLAKNDSRDRHGDSLSDRAIQLDLQALSAEMEVGELLLRDLLSGLTRPGRDPRDDLPPPVFRSDIMKLDDLTPGMELRGTVLNVVDFGAFVDIGLTNSALIHISHLANRFVGDPHEVVSVGDVLTVWVLTIDKERRRVSLTAVEPNGTSNLEQDNQATKQAPAASQKRSAQSRSARPRPPKFRAPRPQKPLSQEMADGKEPLRSFSDLLQFYENKNSPDDSASQ